MSMRIDLEILNTESGWGKLRLSGIKKLMSSQAARLRHWEAEGRMY